MRCRMSPDRLRVAALLGVLLLTAGCGASGQRISMLSLSGDIVFGVPTARPAATPAPQPQPAPVAAAAVGAVLPFPPTGDLAPITPPPAFVAPIPSAPPPLCATAGRTAVAAQVAGADVVGQPVEGAYRWKQTGSVTEGSTTTGLSGFGVHEVRAVSAPTTMQNQFNQQPDVAFTYQTVEPLSAAGDTLTQTWSVHSNEASGSTSEGVAGTPVQATVQYGFPDAGLALREVDYTPAGGGTPQVVFSAPAGPPGTAATGVLYMPFPVVSASTWSSSAADPAHQATVALQGQVGNRYVIDACGELVEGWLAHSTITYSGVIDGAQYADTETVDYVVAPQLGGLIIGQQVKGSNPLATRTATYSIAQLHPSPLPANQR